MRIKTVFSVVPVVLAIALAGCGGGSSSQDKATKNAAGKPNSPEVKKLIADTFGPNAKATSGNIAGTIDIDVKGLDRYKEPVQVSVTGPFQDTSATPDAKFDISLSLRGGILGGDLYLKGDQALIGLGSTAYTIPDSIAGALRAPMQKHPDNALSAVLAVFHITPQRWAKDPRIVGNERVAGIDTIHATANLDTKAMWLDLAALAKRLTALRITDITGLPREVNREARAALQRSVKSASGDIYTGSDDKVLRKAHFDLLIKPSRKDREILGGFESIKVAGNLDVTDVGDPQKIAVPSARGSYPALQVSLDALAEAVK